MNIDILTTDNLSKLRDLSASSQNIIICCHKSPDGDALGASLAWAEYLYSLGKEPTIITPGCLSRFSAMVARNRKDYKI